MIKYYGLLLRDGRTPVACHTSQLLPLLGAGIVLSLCALPLHAQGANQEKSGQEKPEKSAPKLSEIKPVAPAPQTPSTAPSPAPGTPSEKGILPSKLVTPGHTFDASAGTVDGIAAVSGTMAAVPLLLEKFRTQETTPEQAWKSGLLNGTLALELLAHPSLGTLEHRPLVGELARLVATDAPELIADVEKVHPQAKARLATYFLGARDSRAVPFYESILAAIKSPLPQGALPVFKLSDYYAKTGDFKKAAETRLRMKDYTNHPQFLSNSEVEAARFYRRIGEEAKAQELYEGAARHGYGWGSGLALYDRARQLIREEKHEEARALLVTPISGDYTEQIQVALLSLLGYSYYRTGDWDRAREYSQAAIAQEQKVGKLLANEGLEQHVAMAKLTLKYMEQWPKAPLVAEPASLSITVPTGHKPDQPLQMKFGVQSQRRVPIQVTCDNPAVQVQAVPPERAADKGHLFQTKVFLQFSPEALDIGKPATLTIQSPVYPGVVLAVPIHFSRK